MKVREVMLGLESQGHVWGDQGVNEELRGYPMARLGERVFREGCLALTCLTGAPAHPICRQRARTLITLDPVRSI